LWTANVASLISYDYGNHKILKSDFLSSDILGLNAQQTRSYFYPNMTKVEIILSGTWKGKKLMMWRLVLYPVVCPLGHDIYSFTGLKPRCLQRSPVACNGGIFN